MTITDRLPRTPRWVVSAALALGAAFLPLSVAHAQDYAAIERRLAAAVDAGEITRAQAEAMMGALARTAAEKSRPAEADMRAKRMRYAEYQKGVEAAVAKGEMTADEAAAKLAEARTKMFGDGAAGKRDVDPRAMRERYAQLERRIAAAVESGQITKEQGTARLAEAKERMMEASRAKEAGDGQAEARAIRERLAQLEERISAAVEGGLITEEQGAERLAQARERIREMSRAKDAPDEQADMRALRMRYAEYEKGVRAQVEKGDLSAEDAEAKLRLAREKMFGGDKARKLNPEARRKADAERADKQALRMRYAEYEQRLRDSVQKGELSVEEAEAKLSAAREKMFGGDKTRKTGPKAEKKDAAREKRAKKKDAAREKKAAKREGAREKKRGDGARGEGADEAAMKARYAEYEKRLDAAVARGEMTADEAEAKLAEARKEMFGE